MKTQDVQWAWHEAITASAGTGKTEQLAVRYIRLLVREDDPSRILALTFTRVAAGEMLERIMVLLAEAARSEEGAQKLSNRLGMTQPLDCARAGELLGGLLAHLPRLRIATLDSFFLQVVRCYALELGWPLVVQPMDEAEAQALSERALAEVCAAAGDEEQARAMQALFRALVMRKAESAVAKFLREACEQPYGMYWRTRGDAAPWHGFPRQHELPVHEVVALSLFQPGVRERIARDDWWPGVERGIKACLGGAWQRAFDLGPVKSVLAGKKKYGRWEFSDQDVKEMQAVAEHAAAVLLNRAREATAAMYEVLKQYDAALTALKAARGVCAFDDVTRTVCAAAEMLRGRDMFFRLDGRIDHILIDEFQDTSWDQWTALQPLADEILCDQSGERSFFMVGDIKQAIYGWRGGAAELLPRVAEYYGEALVQRVLTESWRAGQHLLDVVNRVFMAEDGTEFSTRVAAWRELTQFKEHVSAERVNLLRPGYCEIRKVPLEIEDATSEGEEEQESGTPCMRSAAWLLAAIRPWERGYKTAALFRTNDEADAMLTVLRARGVPCFIQGKSRLFDNAAVQAVLALLRWMSTPYDRLAALHVRASFLGDIIPDGGDAAAAFLAQQRAELLRVTYPVWIERLVRDMLPQLETEHRQRLMRLIDLAAQYQPRLTAHPADFIAWLEDVRQSEPPASEGVVCSTMHNAKGKTYDVVVLPNLEKNPNKQRSAALYVQEVDDAGVRAPLVECVLRPPQKEKEVAQLNEQFAAMRRAAEDAKWNEYLNLMYVALTRASHAMYIFCTEKPEANTFARWMCEVLKNEEGAVYTAPEECEHLSDHVYYFTPRGNAAWFREKEAVTGVAAVQGGERKRLSEVLTKAAVRHRHQVQPSSHAGPGNRAVYFRPEAREAALRGTALHALFEQVTWLDELPQEQELAAVVRRVAPSLGEDARAEVLRAFYAACAREEVAQVLRRPKEACEVKTELPFTALVRGATVRGVFDRIVCYSSFATPERIDVFDFKSDIVRSAEDIAAREELYSGQLQLYREALQAGYGLALEKIAARLVFVGGGEG